MICCMNFGIDTLGCDHGRSGLGAYLASMTEHLPDADGTEWTLFGEEIDRYTYASGKKIQYVAVNVKDSPLSQKLWHFLHADSFARRHRLSAVLYPAATSLMPPLLSVPGAAVVSGLPRALHGGIRRSLRRADAIIAPSMFIRKKLVECGIPEEKITVIHNGIDHSLFFRRPAEQVIAETVDIKPFAVKRPYFIYASKLTDAGKKHLELIEAFSLFKERTKLPHRLVLAGDAGAYSGAVNSAALESPASHDIFITGYFPHESLPDLYAASDACLVPSVNEGIGLNVLEAMATGVPVACANAGALPEMAGGNALLFDADNVEDIADAMEKITGDEKARQKMIDEGLKWAERFNWQNTAAQTCAVLQKIAGQ